MKFFPVLQVNTSPPEVFAFRESLPCQEKSSLSENVFLVSESHPCQTNAFLSGKLFLARKILFLCQGNLSPVETVFQAKEALPSMEKFSLNWKKIWSVKHLSSMIYAIYNFQGLKNMLLNANLESCALAAALFTVIENVWKFSL